MRWVKLYDSLLEWRWHERPEIVSMFVHLLILANSRDRDYEGTQVKRGQLITSLRDLSDLTGISIQSTRTSLAHLEETGEITRESTHKGTIITICKYADYQSKETLANTPAITASTQHQHTVNTPSTHPLEYKIDRFKDINNSSCCYCLDNTQQSAPAPAREDGISFWSLREEQQQQEQQDFFEIFFFGNFRNVTGEVKRFIATNERHRWQNKGRTECYSTPEQRRAIAQLWRPASKSPRVSSPAFLTMWKKMYEFAKGQDADVARLMLDERVMMGEIGDGRLILVCHQKVWDWITDGSRAKETRAILDTLTTEKINVKIIY